MPHQSKVQLPSQPPHVLVNKNVEWMHERGMGVWYVLVCIATWLVLSCFVSAGSAWTGMQLIHGAVTYLVFHTMKGSPISDDQGKYDMLTFWEQLDDGIQCTRIRLFLTAMPILMLVIGAQVNLRTDPVEVSILNFVLVTVLTVAKLPFMHKVRIFGINKY